MSSTTRADLTAGRRIGDKVFATVTTSSGIIVIALVVGVAAFLLYQAVPSLSSNNADFLTSREWEVSDPSNMRFGVAQLLWTTVISSLVAMVIALPIAVALALLLTQLAPRRIATSLAYVIDLLAAVPSIIFGLWGIRVLSPYIAPVQDFLQATLGWIPVFEPTSVQSGTIFLASVVLAIMILPIMTALSREVFAQTPLATKEAALALGATRWEMIRTTVLPFGASGVISAAMLGLGRALGETVAITLILSATSGAFSWSLFFGGETFASKIANAAAEFDSPEKTGAYIAAGLVLFALTFVVNAIARIIVKRKKVTA